MWTTGAPFVSPLGFIDISREVLNLNGRAFEKDKLNSADKLVKDVYGYLEESFNAESARSFGTGTRKVGISTRNDQWTEEERGLLKKGKCPIWSSTEPPPAWNQGRLGDRFQALITFTPVGAGDDALGSALQRGTDKTWDDNRGNDTLYDATIETEVGACPGDRPAK